MSETARYGVAGLWSMHGHNVANMHEWGVSGGEWKGKHVEKKGRGDKGQWSKVSQL